MLFACLSKKKTPPTQKQRNYVLILVATNHLTPNSQSPTGFQLMATCQSSAEMAISQPEVASQRHLLQSLSNTPAKGAGEKGQKQGHVEMPRENRDCI